MFPTIPGTVRKEVFPEHLEGPGRGGPTATLTFMTPPRKQFNYADYARREAIAANVNSIIPPSYRGKPRPSMVEANDPLLTPSLAKAGAALYRRLGTARDALIPFAGGEGTVIGDAGSAIAELVEAYDALGSWNDEAEADVEANRPKIEAEGAEEETAALVEARDLCAQLDSVRDRIAVARDKQARARDKSGKQRAADRSAERHRPGGSQSAAAALSLEAPVELIYVSPAELKRLEDAGELTPLHRVKHNVPLSAQRGDAPGGAYR